MPPLCKTDGCDAKLNRKNRKLGYCGDCQSKAASPAMQRETATQRTESRERAAYDLEGYQPKPGAAVDPSKLKPPAGDAAVENPKTEG